MGSDPPGLSKPLRTSQACDRCRRQKLKVGDFFTIPLIPTLNYMFSVTALDPACCVLMLDTNARHLTAQHGAPVDGRQKELNPDIWGCTKQ